MGVSRTVVLAGRTLQSLARLHFDLAPLLAVDHRLRLVYALNDGSDRRELAERRATALGIPLVPWKRAAAARPDLVVSASAGPELHEAGAPVALLPHGATYNRVGDGFSGAAGTAREHLVGPGGELPAFMAMPGSAAVERLTEDCPEALAGAAVTGDLCMERLRISRPMRRAYREALGVAPHQRLVVVSSTWGPHSLTAADRDLPRRLLSSLPADEFRVAYVPHPNIDADHGGNLAAWLRPLTRNGLIAVPPEEGWRALLVAADCVIGDHGSVTLYAANLGIPVLLGAFGFDETAPGTPQEAFGKAARWLRRGDDPATQIRAAADRPVGARAAGLREAWLEAAWDESGGAAESVRSHLYRLLRLEPEGVAALELLPRPVVVPDSAGVSAWASRVTALDRGAVRVERFAVFEAPIGAGHLVVRDSCPVDALRRQARVFVVHGADRVEGEADRIAAELFGAYPGCALVSVRVAPGRAVVFGEGRRHLVSGDPRVLDLAPSLLYGGSGSGEFAVGFGGERVSVLVERLP
ncbi:hypothetical protein [Glycomyces dulcitolivorans]|uniref:hypothetical protein n=1 Tax=Glycomyces dulcitolivorans TaxID=2200759 RepID=UPI000DD3A104|nr:hypothetical protein [Glycomyces dulcitolivorans]